MFAAECIYVGQSLNALAFGAPAAKTMTASAIGWPLVGRHGKRLWGSGGFKAG